MLTSSSATLSCPLTSVCVPSRSGSFLPAPDPPPRLPARSARLHTTSLPVCQRPPIWPPHRHPHRTPATLRYGTPPTQVVSTGLLKLKYVIFWGYEKVTSTSGGYILDRLSSLSPSDLACKLQWPARTKLDI